MAKIEFTDDMPDVLVEIVTNARNNGVWNGYELVSYSADELMRCLDYLEANDIYKSLQKEMKIELNTKLSGEKVGVDARINSWFPIYWYAVLSLFNKGPMDKNDAHTKSILAKIF